MTSIYNQEKGYDFERKSAVVRAVRKAGHSKLADDIESCHTYFRTAECLSCGHKFEISTRSCRKRICPICGKNRSQILMKIHKNLTRQRNLKHLILTIKSVQELDGKTKWLRHCFHKLRSRKLFKNSWRGGLYTIEYTYNKKHGWHIHIHALIDGEYIPQYIIAKIWQKVTEKEGQVVWINKAKNTKEILKYILKPSRKLLENYMALHKFIDEVEGSKLISAIGNHYKKVNEKKYYDMRLCPNCGSWEIEYSLTYFQKRYNIESFNGP